MVAAKRRTSREKKIGAYVIGESPLVEEYAELCASYGFTVSVQWNELPKTKPVFKNKTIKHASRIAPNTFIGFELTNINLPRKKKNLQKLDRVLRRDTIILSSSVTVTAAEQGSWMRFPGRLIGISALLSNKLIELAAAPRTEKSSLLKAQDFFMRMGKEISIVQDRIGMVLPRILCMIINEAYFALQEGIASPQDVDRAMKLGTNYPYGPVEWAERLGLQQVHSVLRALQNDLGEDRYRIAPLLKQMAASKSPFFT